MNYIKKILLFSLVLSLVSPMHVLAKTPTIIKAVDTKIKGFNSRVHTYLRCLREGTCTPQERQAAAKTIRQDGIGAISLLAGLLALTAIGYFSIAKYKKTWPFETKQTKRMRQAAKDLKEEQKESQKYSDTVNKLSMQRDEKYQELDALEFKLTKITTSENEKEQIQKKIEQLNKDIATLDKTFYKESKKVGQSSQKYQRRRVQIDLEEYEEGKTTQEQEELARMIGVGTGDSIYNTVEEMITLTPSKKSQDK